MKFKQWFLIGDSFFAPGGHLLMFRDILDYPRLTWDTRLLQASRSQRPGLLLNIFQGTAQLLQQRIIWPHNVNSVDMRNPELTSYFFKTENIHNFIPMAKSIKYIMFY